MLAAPEAGAQPGGERPDERDTEGQERRKGIRPDEAARCSRHLTRDVRLPEREAGGQGQQREAGTDASRKLRRESTPRGPLQAWRNTLSRP